MGEVILKKMVIPAFNRIVTTANKYKEDTVKGGIIDPTKTKQRYMDIQTVVAVGPKAFDVEVGETVSLSFERYKSRPFRENSIANDDPTVQHMTREDVYNIPSIEIDGTEYFLLGDNDVVFKIPEGGWEEKDSSPIYQPPTIV